jgi:hypothetical protein
MYVNLPVSEPRGYSPVGQGTKALTGTSEKKSRHELERTPWDRQGEISLTFLTDLRELRARKSRGPGGCQEGLHHHVCCQDYVDLDVIHMTELEGAYRPFRATCHQTN